MSVFPTPDQSLEYLQSVAPPLRVETVETIMGRLIADVNAGIEPSNPNFLDTTPGSIANDFFSAASMEFDRLWDYASNEVVRAGIPTLAQGPYLDSWAESLELERKNEAPATGEVTFTGAPGTIVPLSAQVSTQAISADADPIVFQTTEGGVIPAGGALTLPVQALLAGSEGSVLANTVTVLVTNIQPPAGGASGVTAVANAEPMAGGADVETDASLQKRVGEALSGTEGAGTIDDYVRWFLAEQSVGNVTVQAAWNGPNTVRVFLTDDNNNPFTSVPFIEALQAAWDPGETGDGAAKGPVGHKITIATPTGEQVTVTAHVEHEPGWSYDGAGGTRSTRGPLTEAVRSYFAGLEAGGKLVLFKVIAAIMDVQGIGNIGAGGVQIGPSAKSTFASNYVGAEPTLKITSAAGVAVGTKLVAVGGGHIEETEVTKVAGTTLTITPLANNFASGAEIVVCAAADLVVPAADVATLANLMLT